MGLLLKPRISEMEAAGIFVRSLARNIGTSWAGIFERIRPEFQSKTAIVDSENTAQREFSLAVIATHLGELHKVFAPEKAERLRGHILSILSDPALGDYSQAALEEYREAWRGALEQGRTPLDRVAELLYEKLGATFSGKGGAGGEAKEQGVRVLSSLLRRFDVSWWRYLAKKYKIPDQYEPRAPGRDRRR